MSSTAPPQYIDAASVRRVLSWPLVNAAVEEALKALKASTSATDNPQAADAPFAEQPARLRVNCGNAGNLLFTMAAFVGNYHLQLNAKPGGATPTQHNTLACKLVTSFAGNKPPLPNILANILLFNVETGQLQCIMDGTQITAWRTAAASIVATKHLFIQRRFAAPSPPNERAIKVAIIGCGVQGSSHAHGLCATFSVSKITLWNRTAAKAAALATDLRAEIAARKEQTVVLVATTAAEACAEADVICVGTFSTQPLVNFEMLKTDGPVHINTVGAGAVHYGEVAQDIYDRAHVYVDSLESAETELKGLKAQIIGDVGAVIRNRNYPNANITIFQSMGMAAEDATVAQAVFEANKALQTKADTSS